MNNTTKSLNENTNIENNNINLKRVKNTLNWIGNSLLVCSDAMVVYEFLPLKTTKRIPFKIPITGIASGIICKEIAKMIPSKN